LNISEKTRRDDNKDLESRINEFEDIKLLHERFVALELSYLITVSSFDSKDLLYPAT
jgi:hypothetical protein